MRFFGRAPVRRNAGGLNKTEQAFANHLDGLKRAGVIREFWPHPFSLRLAKGSHYEPDFLVQRADDVLEIHEVKGFRNALGQTKLKIAAEKFPFRFLLVTKQAKKNGGGWETVEF